MKRRKFEIEVYRDAGWWMIAIPGIDGLTQAESLDQVEAMACSYIAIDQQLEQDEIQLSARVTFGPRP